MTISVAALHDWAQKADHGDELVYRKSGQTRNDKLFDAVRKLSDGGLVFLYQRRSKVGFDHVARRTLPSAHDTLDWVSRSTSLRGQWQPRLARVNPFAPEAPEKADDSYVIGGPNDPHGQGPR